MPLFANKQTHSLTQSFLVFCSKDNWMFTNQKQLEVSMVSFSTTELLPKEKENLEYLVTKGEINVEFISQLFSIDEAKEESIRQ